MAWKKQLAVLLLSVSGLVIVAESYCPDEDFIEPCYCKKDEGKITLICSQVDSVDILERMAENSDGYAFSEVRIQDSKLEYIPAAVMEKVYTPYLVLKNLKLNKLVDNTPNSNPQLKNLVLHQIDCKEGLSWDVFANTANLESLFVDNLEIPTINEDFNKNVAHKLNRLYLRKTNLKKIEKGAFDGFNNLTALSLTNNDLKSLKRDSFPNPFPVKVLLLTNNNLTEIPEDLFSGMPNLKAVFLNKNQLHTISETLFTGETSDLSYANFNDNPIHCDCKLMWITKMKSKSLEGLKGVCDSPKELKGKDLTQLQKEDLKC